MSDRLVALCVRAAAPPVERGGDAGSAPARVADAVRRLLPRLARRGTAPLALALSPTVLGALGDDDLAALRELEAAGRVETCTTGATDAWLPALGVAGQRAQVGAAAADHRRRLARQPLGLWPRDLALPVGLDRHLASAGFRWALVAARALELGRPACPATGPVFLSSGLAAFGVRPLAAADAGADAPLDDRLLLDRSLPDRPPLDVVAVDAAAAADALGPVGRRAEAITPAGYLARYPRNPLAAPAPLVGDDEEASGPYADSAHAAMIRHLRHVEAAVGRAAARSRAFAPAPGLRRRALRQAAREALLAASADWTADEAGASRFRAHVSRCTALCATLVHDGPLDAAFLAAVESRDGALFEEIDPELFAGR